MSLAEQWLQQIGEAEQGADYVREGDRLDDQ